MSQAMILSGRYQVGQRLGEGGMAIVFSGTDLKLQRPVAIKMLRPHLAGDAELVARFNQEAQAAAALNHPNIAAVYDTGQDAGRRYIIMELLPSETLKQRIVESRTGRLAPDEAMAIAIEVGRALAAAHSHGVVHRDIKPANILFTTDGRVKVTDFGIARALAQTTGTATGTILGSPHYLSPEQARGQASGPRSDVYSLGVMLFEMLTGRTPYEGETPVAIALQHVQGTPPPIRSLALGVPAALEAVVAKAMAREPEARFASANELVAALEAVRAGLPAPLGAEATQAFARPPLDATVVMPAVTATSPRLSEPTPYVPEPDRVADNRKLIFGLALFLAIVGGITVGVMFVPHGDVSVGGTVTGGAVPARKQIVVEDLVGRDAEMERARLEEQCRSQNIQPPQVLEMGQEDSPLPLGQITRQEPAAGSSIDEGGIIRVWISTGIERVDVPDVLGLPLADAQQMITGKGLTVGQVKEDYSDSYNEGYIAAQNPAPKSQVRGNSAVVLIVSKGPKPAAPPTPKINPDAPPDIAFTPMEQLDGGQKKTKVSVSLPADAGEATVELRWLEGGHGSPGGGTVSPGNDFSAEVRGDPGAKLGVFVNGKEQKTIGF